jgi:hypothetical protein
MIRIALVLGLLALAACGADGEPVAPAAKAKPGLSVTGEVQFGVETRL